MSKLVRLSVIVLCMIICLYSFVTNILFECESILDPHVNKLLLLSINLGPFFDVLFVNFTSK